MRTGSSEPAPQQSTARGRLRWSGSITRRWWRPSSGSCRAACGGWCGGGAGSGRGEGGSGVAKMAKPEEREKIEKTEEKIAPPSLPAEPVPSRQVLVEESGDGDDGDSWIVKSSGSIWSNIVYGG